MLCSSIWYIGSLTSLPNKGDKTEGKNEALKRESILNIFADGGLNIVDIRTKMEFLFVKQVLQLIKEHIEPSGPS